MNLADFIDLRVIRCLASILSSLMLRDSIVSRISWMIARNHFSQGITKESTIIADSAVIIIDLVVENIEVTVVVVVAVAILDIATDFRIIVVIAD